VPIKESGRLKATRAVGWYIDEYKQAQVSINLINYKIMIKNNHPKTFKTQHYLLIL